MEMVQIVTREDDIHSGGKIGRKAKRDTSPKLGKQSGCEDWDSSIGRHKGGSLTLGRTTVPFWPIVPSGGNYC